MTKIEDLTRDIADSFELSLTDDLKGQISYKKVIRRNR